MITTQLRNGFISLFVFLVSIAPVYAQTTNSIAGNNDWTNAVAWSLGHVPSGTENVEILANANVTGNATFAVDYSGDLILREGATLSCLDYSGDYRDFLPADTNSTIYLNDGSKLFARQTGSNASLTEPMDNPIVIDGAVKLEKGTAFNAGDWYIRSTISGTGSLTWSFLPETTHNNREVYFEPSAPCLYTGGTTVQNLNTAQQILQVRADRAFGTGDLTIKTGSHVKFAVTTSNAIDDSASLYIEGTGVLDLGSNNEQVFQCYIDGIKQPDGDYTSAQPWLVGTGTLTVKGPPSGTVMIIK